MSSSASHLETVVRDMLALDKLALAKKRCESDPTPFTRSDFAKTFIPATAQWLLVLWSGAALDVIDAIVAAQEAGITDMSEYKGAFRSSAGFIRELQRETVQHAETIMSYMNGTGEHDEMPVVNILGMDLPVRIAAPFMFAVSAQTYYATPVEKRSDLDSNNELYIACARFAVYVELLTSPPEARDLYLVLPPFVTQMLGLSPNGELITIGDLLRITTSLTGGQSSNGNGNEFRH